MNAYRFQRLSEAEQHATATGYQGARFRWESALDGTEQIPPPVSVNSEGLYEQHITADIALAQWQYYLVTGDRTWLAQQGWPVLSQAATFWASRATLGGDGRYHINGVTGPDEENPNVNDEVYTNVGAMRTLQDAVQAAQVLEAPAPASSTRRAARATCTWSAATSRSSRTSFTSSPRPAPAGAFTFMTGIGGFLQEFLYGYSGLRWNAGNVGLSPSLSSQIGGIVLHDLQWRGRTFTLAIGPRRTTVRLLSGPPLPVGTGAGMRTVTAGSDLTLPTRRPDLTASTDLVRCGQATASSSQPGAPPLAAVDGSSATDWEPAAPRATLTAPLGPLAGPIRTVKLEWGRLWPPSPAPNVPPPPGPVKVLRPASYSVQISTTGQTWRTVAIVRHRSGRLDTLHVKPGKARFIRIRLTASSATTLPLLQELTATG